MATIKKTGHVKRDDGTVTISSKEFIIKAKDIMINIGGKKINVMELVTKVEELEGDIVVLTNALNETREQVQALLDVNFPNRERWPIKKEE